MSDFRYNVKRENPNDEFVIVSHLNIENGDKVDEGDFLFSLESSKNSYDVEAEKSGYIFFKCEEGDKLDVGELLFVISDNKNFSFDTKTTVSDSGEVKITRKAKKLIEKYNINLDEVLALGLSKIGEDDLAPFISDQVPTKPTSKTVAKPAELPTTDIAHTDEEPTSAKAFEIHYMTQNRDVIYSSVTREISAEKIASIQSNHQGLTLGEIICYSTSKAVKKFPLVNAAYLSGTIRTYNEYNLGLAVNLGKGLKVPVIKNFAELSLEEVSHKFKDISMAYVRDELTNADMTGGTFTVTDLSSLGVKAFLPVVNLYQGSILGICAISSTTNTFNLVLGFDHRLIDGMYGAQFLQEIEKSIDLLTQ